MTTGVHLLYISNMRLEILKKDPALQQLFSINKVTLAYVFGSQVDGTASRNSDMDVAVLFSQELTKTQRFNLRLLIIGKLEKMFKHRVDLVVLNDLRSLFFKYVIISEGELLFRASEEEYLDFECKLMGEYFDFKPFLDLQNKNYVKSSLL